MQKKQSGFDIDLGNQCSKNAFGWAKKTFANRNKKAGEICLDADGAFSHMMDFNGAKIGISSDGIGTKIELAERTGIYNTIGFDLMAMVVDDLIAGGFVPTNISNILDVDLLDYDIVNQLMSGLHDAANMAQVAVTGGEIAELGNRIGGYGDRMHFNWCSTAIGILHPSLQAPISGNEVAAGQTVISLRSRGFRSNGFSAIRKIMRESFGDTWHLAKYDETKNWGEALLTPSLVFSPAIAQVLSDGISIKGIAHITGGGIADNFSRVLKNNQLGADLTSLFEPHEVMNKLYDLGNLPAEKAYLYWNMGNGMLFVVDNDDVDAALASLQTVGYEAQIAGTVTSEPIIRIKTETVDLAVEY